MSSPVDPLIKPRRSVERTLLQAVIVPGVILLTVTIVLLIGVGALMRASSWVDHQDRVLAQARLVEKLLVDQETGVRGYLVTGEELFLEPYDHAANDFDSALLLLQGLAIRPENKTRINTLKESYRQWLEHAQVIIKLRGINDPRALSTALNAKGKRAMDDMRQQLNIFAVVAETLRDQRASETSSLTWTLIAFAVILALAGSLCVTLFTYRRIRQVASEYETACAEQFQDSLTGLFNRKGFATVARHQAQFAARADAVMCLYYLDLDGLKAINDEFGHAAGSQALVDFAGVLSATFRSSDTLARLSGDEFAVLATHEQPQGSNVVLERLQSKLHTHNLHSGRPYTVSVSIGVVDYKPDQTLDAALMEADMRMYEQKKAKKGNAQAVAHNSSD